MNDSDCIPILECGECVVVSPRGALKSKEFRTVEQAKRYLKRAILVAVKKYNVDKRYGFVRIYSDVEEFTEEIWFRGYHVHAEKKRVYMHADCYRNKKMYQEAKRRNLIYE
jgi:ferredoxin